MTDARIFHITTRQAADAALASGAYRAPSLDAEGFIHFSQAHQLQGVARAFYAGQTGLVVLTVDPALLTAPLQYEPPGPMTGHAPLPDMAQLFPHLYGPLNASAIVDVQPLNF